MQTMQSDLFYCKITLHVSGDTGPIIRSAKNCIIEVQRDANYAV